MGTEAILNGWPSLLRLIPVTSRTSNGTSLGLLARAGAPRRRRKASDGRSCETRSRTTSSTYSSASMTPNATGVLHLHSEESRARTKQYRARGIIDLTRVRDDKYRERWDKVTNALSGLYDGDCRPNRADKGADPEVVFNKQSSIYHRRSCSSARRCTKNCITITLSEAQKRRVRACQICGGPATSSQEVRLFDPHGHCSSPSPSSSPSHSSKGIQSASVPIRQFDSLLNRHTSML